MTQAQSPLTDRLLAAHHALVDRPDLAKAVREAIDLLDRIEAVEARMEALSARVSETNSGVLLALLPPEGKA